MGLAEKRAVKAFQDDKYKKLVSEINTFAGYSIEFDVKWDTIALEEYAEIYEDSFTYVYFTPIIDAVKEIANDDMGKEALKEVLKKVVIKNESDNSSASRAYSYDKGVLVVDHMPFTNVNNVSERRSELQDLLMKKM